MLALWTEAGFDPDSFWRQTPRTFSAVMDGVGKRRDADRERDIDLAYVIEGFARSKDINRLRSDLRSAPEPKKLPAHVIARRLRLWTTGGI